MLYSLHYIIDEKQLKQLNDSFEISRVISKNNFLD